MKPAFTNGRRVAGLAAIVLSVCLAAAIHQSFDGASEPGWYVQASRLLAAGKIPEAEELLSKGVAQDPKYAPAYEMMADAYIAVGRYDLSLAALTRLLAIDRQRPHLATRFAETAIASDAPSLLQAAREAVVQEPRSPRAHLLLAYGFARNGAGKDALLEARAAAQLSDSPEVTRSVEEVVPLQSNPDELARALKLVIYSVSYE